MKYFYKFVFSISFSVNVQQAVLVFLVKFYFMANRKKQATLFNFEYSRRVPHRGESYDLAAPLQGPSFVEDENVLEN